MSKVPCPGCAAPVEPKYASGETKNFSIPPHNPLPGNSKGADPKKPCPGVTKIVKNYKPADGLVG